MIFCKEIRIKNVGRLKSKGPLLLVANHPNSFLDAIVIGSLFQNPVHFLARGDAFNKPWHSRLLGMMNMIPVYRMSEGRENLHLNAEAFKRSKEVLNAGGIVLIFIEGICVNKHELQPFKKGAARIAMESKKLEGFRVISIGMAYDSFEKFGKTININIGEPVHATTILPYDDQVTNIKHFNEYNRKEIQEKIQAPVLKSKTSKKYNLLKPFAVLGFVSHGFLLKSISGRIKQKTKGTVFYDSVLFGTLLVFYPLALITSLLFLFWLGISFKVLLLLLFLFPFTAWCAVQLKQK